MCRRPASHVGMSRPKKRKPSPLVLHHFTEIDPDVAEPTVSTSSIADGELSSAAATISPGKQVELDLLNDVEMSRARLDEVRKAVAEQAVIVADQLEAQVELGTAGPPPPHMRRRDRQEWQELARKFELATATLLDHRDQLNLDFIQAECDFNLDKELHKIAKVARLERKLAAAGVDC